MKSKRIEWVDIFKGILIFLMVIGHSSNIALIPWIYSFHMAGFFFISGYTTDYEKQDFVTCIKKKAKTLLLPFFTINISIFILQVVLKMIGIYDIYYKVPFSIENLLNFLKYFWTLDLAAATWFLFVLFMVSVLSRFLYEVIKSYCSKKTITIHFCISFVLFFIFYLLYYRGAKDLPYFLDLIPISMFFFSAGLFASKNKNMLSLEYRTIFKVLLICFFFVSIAFSNQATDWACRVFPSLNVLLLNSFGGIVLLSEISKLIVFLKNKIKIVYDIFIYLGKHTMAVLTYHFIGFKIMYTILYFCNYLDVSKLTSLVPPYYGFLSTLLTAVFATAFSIMLDYIVKKGYYFMKKIIKKISIPKIKISNCKFFFTKAILIGTVILFSIILFSSFFYDSNVFYSQNKMISLGISFIILIIWYLLFKGIVKSKRELSKKQEIIYLVIYFSVLLILQICVLKYLSVYPEWDFGVVFGNAESYVLNGERNKLIYPGYFQYFPNNILLFQLIVFFIKAGMIFGVSALHSAWLMNLIFINLSYLFLYLTLRKKFGVKPAIFGSIIALFFISVLLYSSIFYSDTLSLFVGILFIYLYLLLDSKYKNKRIEILIFCLFGFLLFYAKEIKITSAIPLIAILFDYVMKNYKEKTAYSNILIMLFVFLILGTCFKALVVNNNGYGFNEGDYRKYPYTHWIMMGIEDIEKDNSKRMSYGGYNYDDYILTENCGSTKKAIVFNLKEYVRRVNKMGALGYIDYLTKKGVNEWADGMYYVDVKLHNKPIHPENSLYRFMIQDDSKMILIYFTQGVQFAFLILLIGGAIIKLLNKSDKLDYIRLSILGVFIFLLFWEGRSRYLLNFIPLFILIIVESYMIFEKKLQKRK